MCKLCKSDQYPICFKTHPRIKRSKKSKEFCDAVEQYTGEYPCERCNNIYMSALRNSCKITYTSDTYIIKKLFYWYQHPTITSKYRNKILCHCEKKYNGIQPKIYLKKHKVIYTTIEKHIQMITNAKGIVYNCEIQINFNRYRKSFKTLEEAQQFKKEVLNGNYTHTTK